MAVRPVARNDPSGATGGRTTDAFLLDSAVQLGRCRLSGVTRLFLAAPRSRQG